MNSSNSFCWNCANSSMRRLGVARARTGSRRAGSARRRIPSVSHVERRSGDRRFRRDGPDAPCRGRSPFRQSQGRRLHRVNARRRLLDDDRPGCPVAERNSGDGRTAGLAGRRRRGSDRPVSARSSTCADGPTDQRVPGAVRDCSDAADPRRAQRAASPDRRELSFRTTRPRRRCRTHSCEHLALPVPGEDLQEVERAVATFLESDDTAVLVAAITQFLEGNPASASAAPAEVRSERSVRHLRVDSERVDALVALTAELIVAKNAVARIAKSAEESGNALAQPLQGERARLDRLLSRLQETVLNLRVVPLRTVFQRFQRIVRELAIELSKPAVLVIEGEDTETDRTIADMVFERLLHIVRNAMDHGVETEMERRATGKPAIATITLACEPSRRKRRH